MTRRLTEKEIVDIIDAFTIDLEPMISIAKRYKRTRQSIWKMLHRHGINPSDYGKITVSCTACGEPIERHRMRIRRNHAHFCNNECYYAFIENSQNGSYHGNRHGQRIGRAIVSQYFDLRPEHIVHHIDRNSMNNDPKNLQVYANQGDHIRHHREALTGIKIRPLWEGLTV